MYMSPIPGTLMIPRFGPRERTHRVESLLWESKRYFFLNPYCQTNMAAENMTENTRGNHPPFGSLTQEDEKKIISSGPKSKQKASEIRIDFCQTRLMTSDVSNVVTIIIVVYAKPDI